VSSMKKMLGVAAAAVVALGACSSTKSSTSGTGSSGTGSSASSSSSGGTQAPGGTTTGITPTEIHVGSINYKSFFGDATVGAQARIKRENDAGGVNGRKIVLDQVIDDGQDSTQDLNAAKTLVEQAKVFALVPVMTANLSSADYLEQHKVPFFGWSIEPRWCNKQYAFGMNGNDCDPSTTPETSDFAATEKALFPDGQAQGKTIGQIAEDNNSARVALESFVASWEHNGAKVVIQDTSMPTPPAVVGDYTPFAEKLLTSNGGKPPDLIQMVMSVSDTLGLYKKLVSLGYKGVVQDFTLYDPRLAASTKGLATNIQFAPYESASSVPAVQRMVTDLKAADPNVILSQPAAAGYWSMDLFIAMLKKTGPNLTRESFMQTANGNFTWNYGAVGGALGGVGQVEFPKNHSGGALPCQSFVTSTGSAFAVTIPLTCNGLIPNPLYKK